MGDKVTEMEISFYLGGAALICLDVGTTAFTNLLDFGPSLVKMWFLQMSGN